MKILFSGIAMNILMVLTSHGSFGETGKKTGFWLKGFTAPYFVLVDAGATVTLASPNGGQPPLDPRSDEPGSQTEDTFRFRADPRAQNELANTLKLSSISPANFDAIFYPGGHGPLWDLVEDPHSISLIETLYASGKPVVAVCHGSGVLRHVKAPDGRPLVAGKQVTGFSNSEEAAVGLADAVPFLVEDELKAEGGLYSKGADWEPYIQVDGTLITGQNPASSKLAAEALVQMLEVQAEAVKVA